jgi:hypothetical protein
MKNHQKFVIFSSSADKMILFSTIFLISMMIQLFAFLIDIFLSSLIETLLTETFLTNVVLTNAALTCIMLTEILEFVVFLSDTLTSTKFDEFILRK